MKKSIKLLILIFLLILSSCDSAKYIELDDSNTNTNTSIKDEKEKKDKDRDEEKSSDSKLNNKDEKEITPPMTKVEVESPKDKKDKKPIDDKEKLEDKDRDEVVQKDLEEDEDKPSTEEETTAINVQEKSNKDDTKEKDKKPEEKPEKKPKEDEIVEEETEPEKSPEDPDVFEGLEPYSIYYDGSSVGYLDLGIDNYNIEVTQRYIDDGNVISTVTRFNPYDSEITYFSGHTYNYNNVARLQVSGLVTITDEQGIGYNYRIVDFQKYPAGLVDEEAPFIGGYHLMDLAGEGIGKESIVIQYCDEEDVPMIFFAVPE